MPRKNTRKEFTGGEVKETLATLDAMIECAVDREDKKDEKALRIARNSTLMILGDGNFAATSVPWPAEEKRGTQK